MAVGWGALLRTRPQPYPSSPDTLKVGAVIILEKAIVRLRAMSRRTNSVQCYPRDTVRPGAFDYNSRFGSGGNLSL
jgi:hypothetical protein